MSLQTLITVSVLPEKKIPVAVAKADPDYGIIGSVVKVDGRLSTDPDGNPLTYAWTFDSVPIGSQVRSEGFRLIDEDGGLVSFSPDIVGEYVIGLTVSNGMFTSDETQTFTTIRAILVPHGTGLVPDGKWIWAYIRDIWSQVENKEIFETLWSALIQIIGAELLKLYQVDFNKSIRDIQDLYQRRWISYEPELEILVNGPDFFLGKHFAGTDASTVNLGISGALIMLNPTEVIVVEGSILTGVAGEILTITSSSDPLNNKSYTVQNINSTKDGYKLSATNTIPDPTSELVATDIDFIFSFQSNIWFIQTGEDVDLATLLSESGSFLDVFLPITGGGAGSIPVRVGDVIIYKTGLNKGYYRVTSVSGLFITVDKRPPSFSDATTVLTYKADVYRPVSFTITQPDALLTDTIAIPFDPAKDISDLATGRVIVVNGQTYTVVRTSVDNNQRQPTVIVTVDRPLLQTGLSGLTWRTPPTLVSTTQDFGVDGVSAGDVIKFNIVQDGQDVSTVTGQVAGVDRGRLGFVMTTEPLQPGIAPPVSPENILQVASDFGIDGVAKSPDGTLLFSGTAAKYLQEIQSGIFQNKYFNIELTPDSDISINPTYQIKPRTIIRNNTIPVDTTLRSVPSLQNFIVQPDIIKNPDGSFSQLVRGQTFPVPGPALMLRENIHYIVDDEFAFVGQLSFQTGTDVIEFDDGDFIDRGITPGDQFTIIEPITLARTYYVQAVLSDRQLKLTRPVPLYTNEPFVTAQVQIKRSKTGNFIRFTPGQFSADKPAPNRLWAEVSLYDNNENVENNFGILVGLTRDDIEAVSADLNYRQAVSGIMFAFLRGSSIEKIRLGAQILLGLPFAESRGIIRSIEGDYRLDTSGNPIQGRLLIEDVDNTGAALGTLRPYIFPVDPISDLAGLETNPATGKLYAVGDIVEKFAALSKGVEVLDYISNPLDIPNSSVSTILKQYHSLRMKVNDNLFTLQEIGLVSSFLRKITPSYMAFFISSLSEFVDTVTVNDAVVGRIVMSPGSMIDQGSLCIPPTIMFDSKSMRGGVQQIHWDDGAYWVRRFGADANPAGGVINIPSGGVLNPRTHEQFFPPLMASGDQIILFTGLDVGIYTITTISSDTQFVVGDGPAMGFQNATGIRYALVRPIREFFFPVQFGGAPDPANAVTAGQGTANLANVQFAFSLRTLGVAPGDLLHDPTGSQHPRVRKITSVFESTPGSGNFNTASVTPPYTGGSAVRNFGISRSKVLKSPYPVKYTIRIGADGHTYSDFVNGSSSFLQTLAEVGDEIVLLDANENPYDSLTVLSSEDNFLTASTANTTVPGARLIKRKGPFYTNTPDPVVGSFVPALASGITWDMVGTYDPIDSVDASLVEDQHLASLNNALKTVTLQMQRTTAPTSGPTAVNPVTLKVKPGDFIKFTSGAASAIDLGYGAGIYPIVAVSSSNVTIVATPPSTESVSWSIIRRR